MMIPTLSKSSQSKMHGAGGDASQTLYLIDISSFIFRAFFAIRSLTNSKGEPTNAVYGVATMLARLADEAKPEYLAVVYDSKEPSFRKEIYTEYKANRAAAPDDLIPQFDRIEQLVTSLEIPSFRQSGIEADDLIGTLTKKWCATPQHRVVIVSGDKDLMQLVDDRVCVWDTMANKVYGPAEVEEKFQVKPTQLRDYLALVGDSSDNIPGVPSIGPKSAVDLLRNFHDLDGIIQAAKAEKIPGKKGQTIRDNVKDARLSADLATIRMELPVKIAPESARYQFRVTDACLALLKELDFHSLVAKWSGGGPAPKTEEAPETAADPETTTASPTPAATIDAPPGRFRTVNTEAAFKELLAAIEKKGEFGFDLETTSLNPRLAEIVGVAICHDPEFSCYIPIGHRGTEVPQLPEKRVLEALKPYLENPKYKKIGQNLKYDWSVLRCLPSWGFKPDGIGMDTMVAAYVLEPEGRHNLETLSARYLSYGTLNYEQVCGKGKDQIGFDLVPIDLATRYSAEDAWLAVRLRDVLLPKLQAEGLTQIYSEVDLPMVDVLSRMECQGVCIDEAWLAKLSKEFETELKGVEERIGAFTKGPINLNSPKQLGVLLFDELKLPAQGKTKTGYSTDAKVLDALAPLHEVPRLLLEYREISKLKGTYVDTLPKMKDPKTGKIHAGFHQTVAATGRLSSSDPNLQNIPIRSERGLKIRGAFLPTEGSLLVSADYSQIELRILAHMSGDEELIRSFRSDEDVHRRTASELYSVKPEEVTDRQRGIAKAINFGLMYGKTPFGLAQELKIPRKEAQEIIDKYFQRYHAVKRFLDNQILGAKENGFVTTILGRKRYLPDIRANNPMMRQMAERMAMNTPIQGTAADLMKVAMLRLDDELGRGKFKSKLILQVHDEFVLDSPKDEAEEACKLMCKVMESAMELKVPLKVNSSMGKNWMEL